MRKKKTHHVVKSDRGKKAFLSADRAYRAYPAQTIHFVKKVKALDAAHACDSVQ